MFKPSIAVILFPGINCHEETLLSLKSAGIEGKILRWNSHEDLGLYDGYVIPGGFSYEDRIRSGVICAQDPIMLKIKEEATKGKPVLGICNGAQILVESGLIPGLKNKVEMALAPNNNPFVSGYYCTWVYIKSTGNSIFNRFYRKGEVVPMPIAHGEGRFTTKDENLIPLLIENGQICFRYCDKDGRIVGDFPVNPNGSMDNIAAVSNKEGNVLALMPHPERANWARQVPLYKGKSDGDGPGRKIFLAFKESISEETGK